MVRRGWLAIVPARGGSKRIPGKNIVDFWGKPLLAWSIEAGNQAGLFDRVLVSTDDPKIAETARAYGADVPFLRQKHQDDIANVSDVALHVLDQVEQELGETYENVCHLQASCPLRTADDVRRALTRFKETGTSFQMSCFRFEWTNPWWAFHLKQDRTADYLFPNFVGVRSQDQPPLYGLTGAICLAKTVALRQSGSFYGPGQTFEPISWISAVDIDTEDDLKFAKAAHAIRQGLI